jgi:chitinase
VAQRWRASRLDVTEGTAAAIEFSSRASSRPSARQIVGWSRSSPTTHASLWAHGNLVDLGTLGGDESYASGINDRGQVIGASWTKTGATHAFVWENGAMTDLGHGGNTSEAFAINTKGQIVGYRGTGRPTVNGYMPTHAVLWTPISD